MDIFQANDPDQPAIVQNRDQGLALLVYLEEIVRQTITIHSSNRVSNIMEVILVQVIL